MEDELRDLERLMAVEFGWTQWITPYSALPTSTSIRLLQVNSDGPIECSIKIVNLDQVPVYSALSYTWGNPRGILPPGESAEVDRIKQREKHKILLEGVPFEVSVNLHAFLVSFQKLRQVVAGPDRDVLRGLVTKYHVKYIWIDAICINQESLQEKTTQVPIMDRVYRQSQKVFVWLGPADSLTWDGLSAMARIASVNRKISQTAEFTDENLSKLGGAPTQCPLFDRFGLQRISARDWYGVLTVLRRSWFSRAWTRQEFALAREACFLIDTKFSDWQLWSSTAMFLIRMGWLLELVSLEQAFSDAKDSDSSIMREYEKTDKDSKMTIIHDSKVSCVVPITLLIDLRGYQATVSRQRWLYASKTLPLQRFLGLTLSSKASVRQDYVYAYLGLVPQESWQGLEVDYERPLEDTYTQATWSMIQSTQELSILSHVEEKGVRTLGKLPSWVPDFSAARRHHQLDPGSRIKFAGTLPGVYDATKGSRYALDISNNLSRVLTVRGQRQSTIEVVERDLIQDDDLVCLEISPTTLHCILQLPDDHYWRTIVSDHDIWQDTSPASTNSCRYLCQAWIRQIAVYSFLVRDKMPETERTRIKTNISAIRATFSTYLTCCGSVQPWLCQLVAPGDCAMLSEEALHEHIEAAFHNSLSFIQDAHEEEKSAETAAVHSKVLNSIYAHMVDRKLFVTSDGRIAKGPTSTQAKDEVWLLHGAQVPYVLRSLGNGTFEFVGEAYVHGIMQGEAFDESEKSSVDIAIV